MTATLRAMRPGDLDAAAAIAARAFDPPWTRAQLAEELEKTFARCLCVLEDDAVVAYAIGWVLAGELEVLSVATDPAQRRRGHARVLMQALLREAETVAAPRAFLEVRADNAPARALYASLGFRDDGVRARYYADGTDAVIMARQAT